MEESSRHWGLAEVLNVLLPSLQVALFLSPSFLEMLFQVAVVCYLS